MKIRTPMDNFVYQTKSISVESTPSGIDSISSAFIEKQKGLRLLTQPRKIDESDTVKLGTVGSNVFMQLTTSTSINQQMRILSIENKVIIIIHANTKINLFFLSLAIQITSTISNRNRLSLAFI
jgi:hypothetical protein